MLVPDIIAELYKTAERIAGSILDWEAKKGKEFHEMAKRIENKRPEVFDGNDKILISEYINEFGQQSTKIPLILGLLERLFDDKIEINHEYYPNLYKFMLSDRYSLPPTISLSKKQRDRILKGLK